MMAKILVVEDTADSRYMLVSLLQGSGYEVVSATNGAEALAAARSAPPDLIVTDIMMPVMDGFDLCRCWRQDDQLRRIPFIIYTATYTDPKDESLAMGLGADRFLTKPQQPDVLLQIVREVLEQGVREDVLENPAGNETDLLRMHNAALFRKLEKKVRQLEAEIERRNQAESSLHQMQKDLDLARQIHARNFPTILPRLPGATINVQYIPLHAVGGDFYDFAELGGGRVGILIADVMGHGMAAALDASSVRIAFKDAMAKTNDPAEVLGCMNRFLCPHLNFRFVSAAYAEIDTERMLVRVSYAGHPPGLLVSKRKNEVTELFGEGLLLGVTPDSAYRSVEHAIEANDSIFLFTDGLYEDLVRVEAESTGIQLKKSMLSAVSRIQPEADLAILADMNQMRNSSQTDDITLLSVRIGTASNQTP